jgi:ElaA protein
LEIKPYNRLSLDEFHDLIQLRIKVFVIEQDCPYQDLDGRDKVAEHLIVVEDGVMMATLRILSPGIAYKEWSIGRVVVDETARGTGLGHRIMEEAVRWIDSKQGSRASIKLSAQEHLRSYYERHGFEQCGEGYLEDGIPHIPMLRSADQ